jgi:hypothetical protein
VFLEALRRRSKPALTRLYFAAVEAAWWENSEDHRVRFLTIAHHAATSGDSPMALLTSLCRRLPDGSVLRSSRCPDASRDWPSEVRRYWRLQADSVLAEAERERVQCVASRSGV